MTNKELFEAILKTSKKDDERKQILKGTFESNSKNAELDRKSSKRKAQHRT